MPSRLANGVFLCCLAVLLAFAGATVYWSAKQTPRDFGNFGYIDSAGTMVIPPQFEMAYDFSEGLAAIRVDNSAGFIDTTGELVVVPQFDDAGDFSQGLAPEILRSGDKQPRRIPRAALSLTQQSGESRTRGQARGLSMVQLPELYRA